MVKFISKSLVRQWGSPVSTTVAYLYMEFSEQHTITTALVKCAPRLWKRYMDNNSEVIKKRQVVNLKQHLNKADATGSIKFTYEEEKDGKYIS